jgi:archaellum component FlaF (FlaF/FlaG flagellin family)
VDSANGDYTLAIILISGISTLACIATYLFMLYAVKTLRVENVQRTLTDQPTRRKNTSISVSFESVKTLRVENVQKTLTDQPTGRENTSISVSFESSSDEEQVSPTYNIKTQGMLIKLKDVL